MIEDRSNDVIECQNPVLVYLYVVEGMPGVRYYVGWSGGLSQPLPASLGGS